MSTIIEYIKVSGALLLLVIIWGVILITVKSLVETMRKKGNK